jgi:hypothetical protein
MKRIALLFLLSVLLSPQLLSQSACNCEIPLDTSFHIVPMTKGPDPGTAPYYRNDNAATSVLPLGFSFCFYDQVFNSVVISNNGIIYFGSSVFTFITEGGFPLGTDSIIIAPFYADIYTRSVGGLVYYKKTPTYMVVTWSDVGYFTTDIDSVNTFQLIISNGNDPILPAGTNVSFCYVHMRWACSDVSGGFDGFGGVPAIVGINRGNGTDFAQVGSWSVPGTTYYGPFSQYDGVEWLDNKSFSFSTCTAGDFIPLVLMRENGCDTIPVCAGDAEDFTAKFITTQQGQTCTLSATCNGLPGFSIVDTSTVNGIDSITVHLATTTADVGEYTLSISATDNSNSPQTSLQTYIVNVQSCVGISEINAENDFEIYPNPVFNSAPLTIEAKFKISSIEIYSSIGEEVYSDKDIHRNSYIIRHKLDFGIYFVKLIGEKGAVGLKKISVQ